MGGHQEPGDVHPQARSDPATLPPNQYGWKVQPTTPVAGPGIRVVGRCINLKIRGEKGPNEVWVTSQTNDVVNFSRMDAVWTQFYPKINPGDPDVSYDVMCQGAAIYVLGRFDTEARAIQIRNEIIAAEGTDTDYTVPDD